LESASRLSAVAAVLLAELRDQVRRGPPHRAGYGISEFLLTFPFDPEGEALFRKGHNSSDDMTGGRLMPLCLLR